MATLGDLERSVMDVLWAADEPLGAGEIHDRIAALRGDEHALTTVMTVLSRLERKQLVDRSRETRPHRYRALLSRAEHTANLMHDVLSSSRDRDAALARFIGGVSRDEARTLQRLLNDLAE